VNAQAATSFAGSSAGAEKQVPVQLRECSFAAVVAVTRSGHIAYVNDAFVGAMAAASPSELIGTDFRNAVLVDPKDWEVWTDAKATRGQAFRVKDLKGRGLTLSGDLVALDDANSELLAYGAFVPDVEAGRMEHLMQHAARMEAVAGMSTGIAHDFNNLLTVLIGNLYLVGEQMRDNEAVYAKLKIARDTAMRGADLTRQLLNFARDDEPSLKDVQVAGVVTRLAPLLEKLVGSRIRLKTRTNASTATVAINTSQLHSAIVNLVINARDAIDGEGTVLIDLKEANVRADNALGLPAGRYIKLAVADDGAGIPTSVIARVFDAFYTTKTADKGTGLGLSMVRWACERARGRVAIRSQPGEGTVVTMILPVGEASADETSSRTMPLSVLPSGQESILLSIGDIELRSMTQQSLAVLGYDVHVCEDAGDLPKAIGGSGAELVLLDRALYPDSSGAVELTRKAKLDVKVLLLSDEPTVKSGSAAVLQKPFSLAELATIVRKVLDGAEHND
jgi:signal transduction histidine kinase